MHIIEIRLREEIAKSEAQKAEWEAADEHNAQFPEGSIQRRTNANAFTRQICEDRLASLTARLERRMKS